MDGVAEWTSFYGKISFLFNLKPGNKATKAQGGYSVWDKIKKALLKRE